ncbi:MAG: nucleotide exchange factor GrpE [Alphaproteobacteria bacterium]
MTDESKLKPTETDDAVPGGISEQASKPIDKGESAGDEARGAGSGSVPDAATDSSEAVSPTWGIPGRQDPDPQASDADSESTESALIDALNADIADLKDRLLRAAAEMENMRRRFEREMADTRQYAVTGFAREVLSIGDNLGRALEAVPDDAQKEEGAMASLLAGVEMTERELLRVLDKHNVKRLEPHGEKFDPNFHQAIFEVEHAEAPHGTVVQVVQPGYSIGERVLRPAMVGIAKKKKLGPATDKQSEAAVDDDEKPEDTAENTAGA